MDDLILINVFDDDMMEILPPNRNACTDEGMSSCNCCGRRAVMDDDCCGICEECLSP